MSIIQLSLLIVGVSFIAGIVIRKVKVKPSRSFLKWMAVTFLGLFISVPALVVIMVPEKNRLTILIITIVPIAIVFSGILVRLKSRRDRP